MGIAIAIPGVVVIIIIVVVIAIIGVILIVLMSSMNNSQRSASYRRSGGVAILRKQEAWAAVIERNGTTDYLCVNGERIQLQNYNSYTGEVRDYNSNTYKIGS